MAGGLHGEFNVRVDVKTSNSVKFRHNPLLKVIELCVTYPSVHVTEAWSYAGYGLCHA